ncbi:hypothetical protein [Sphingomonas sp.]|uniref:hypothetical protein n=1 Tax=Sphingomonas sp. TaxID=28214 RepID=UPI001B24E3A5|nr:hypothetical protein [Sphingomonas sp.]MBO9713614.1 hypothetical protein [Sphingomonas sp.]
MQLNIKTLTTAAAVALILASADPAQAYLGPGLGLGAISTALGVLGAILLGIVSMVWYPVKRLVRRMRGRAAQRPAPARADEGTVS